MFRNPQRPYAELPIEFLGWDEDMVHALWRHRDHVNYNGPKVSESLAPVVSNGGVRIRLNAGTPGESDGTQ